MRDICATVPLMLLLCQCVNIIRHILLSMSLMICGWPSQRKLWYIQKFSSTFFHVYLRILNLMIIFLVKVGPCHYLCLQLLCFHHATGAVMGLIPLIFF